MFKTTLKHSLHTLWITFLVIFIGFAALMTLARLVSPLLARDTAAIERLINRAIAQPITIGSLAIKWRGLEPVLLGKHVAILDPQGITLLKADALEVDLNLLRSLFSGGVRLEKVRVSGANFTLQQNDDDSITLIGVTSWSAPTTGDSKILDEMMTWLLAQPKVELDNIALTWKGNNGEIFAFQNLDLKLTNHGMEHHLLGQAQLAQTVPTQLAFIINANGDWQNKQKFNANFYATGKELMLKQWLHDYPAVKQGILNFQLWGSWQQRLQNIHTLFSLKALKIAGDHHFAITALSGNVLLQPDVDHNWQMAGDIASKNSIADFGALFRSPIPIDKFIAHVEAQEQEDGWLLQASQVAVRNAVMSATANMGLFFPDDEKQSATLSLLAAAHLTSRLPVADYLPLPVLKPSLVKWLDDSIKGFDGIDSTLIINGSTADYPFDSNSGRFIVDSVVKNLKLDYYPGWPMLTNATGHLVFAERNMDYLLASGKVSAIPLSGTHVYIPVIKKNIQAVLNIDDNNVKTSLDQGLDFLRHTPLKKGPLATVLEFNGSGPIVAQLHIVIPLDQGKTSTQINGNVKLQNNTLIISQKGLQLQNLVGQLDFTQDALTAKGLLAKLWGKPAVISMVSQPSKQVSIQYGDMNAVLSPLKNSWSVALTAPGISGRIGIPQDSQQPLEANFSRLFFSDKDDASSNQSTKQQWSVKDLPRVNFTANDVRYGVKHFGEVRFQLIPQPWGAAIQNLTMRTPAANMVANGSWRAGITETTQLSGVLTSSNISAALLSWGLPAGLTAQQSRMQFNLNWPDSANQPSLKKTSGQITLSFSKGQITDVGKDNQVKMNIGRLLTSMSLRSFSRYLRFDFRNLTAPGFEFDTIKGDFTLRNGDAYTQNLTINGPIANVAIAGRIGLAAENYDLQVTVKPNLTSGVPFIIALVNPIAGAASLVANTILSPVVSQITADTYHMSGSWSKPVIVKP